jgi:5-methylcytosine-specific restriction endonuclease McrA
MRKGQKTSPETKLKQSLAHRGKKKDYPVWNKGKKIGNLHPNSGKFQKGHKQPQDQIEKMRKALTGRTWTVEQREKNRQGQIRRFTREIPNYQFEDNGRQYRRKRRLVQNGGCHSRGEWEILKAQVNWTCISCKRREPEIKLTKDHIIPILKGGSNNIENIQPLCRSCNTRKGIKIINLIENRANSGEVQNG